jgi:leucyl-tRNA synthetase
VYYVNGLPQMIDGTFAHYFTRSRKVFTEDGLPPLGNAAVWAWDSKVVNTDLVDNQTIFPLELNTMPGWAGSSFWMRYMMIKNGSLQAKKH